eukprot:m.713076 g.713076  ORF g.713076 m.713076 type:complete len:233 (+) comp58780_c0_seq29:1184-1882(+)
MHLSIDQLRPSRVCDQAPAGFERRSSFPTTGRESAGSLTIPCWSQRAGPDGLFQGPCHRQTTSPARSPSEPVRSSTLCARIGQVDSLPYPAFCSDNVVSSFCGLWNSIFIDEQGSVKKSDCRLAFPLALNLDPFVSTGTFVNAPLCLTNAGPVQPPYRLVAVVAHFGSAVFGHFVTYRLRPPTSTDTAENEPAWLHISDDAVRIVPESEVLRAKPYMLFYEAASEPLIGSQD